MKELYTTQRTADPLPYVHEGQLPIGTFVLIIPIVLIVGLALGRYSRDREEREKKLNKLLEAFEENGGDVTAMSATVAQGKQQVASATLVPPAVQPVPPVIPAVGNVVQLPVPPKRVVPPASGHPIATPTTGAVVVTPAKDSPLLDASTSPAINVELELVPVEEEAFVDPNPGVLALFDDVPPPECFGKAGDTAPAYEPSDEEVQEAAREAFAAQQQ